MRPERTINICFHGIGEPGRALEPGESTYWITPDQYLRTLDELAALQNVRISFDDANASDAEIGLGPLLDRNLTATFFALAGRIGRAGSLDADQLRHLRASGMSIGTHGMDHRPWTALASAERHRELVVARETLSDIVGTGIDQAALPLGRYNRVLLKELRRLGYARVHTSDRTWASPDSWLQPRFSARRDDTLEAMHRTVLTAPNLTTQMRNRAVGFAKRLR
ncbi:MAG: polysaccharide deacetylase family protein [Candidatus Nanopelagicales bacterium]